MTGFAALVLFVSSLFGGHVHDNTVGCLKSSPYASAEVYVHDGEVVTDCIH